MVEIVKASRSKFDLSFQYSNECDLHCSFCMYSCGPEVKDRLDLDKLKSFIKTIDFGKCINSIGLYGGEVSLHLEEYTKIVKMLPKETKVWTITNGTWSKELDKGEKFLTWAKNNNISPIIVSGNYEQQNSQDTEWLVILQRLIPSVIILKESDAEFLSMGRLANQKVSCSEKCFWKEDQATRIAVMPSGNIMFQTCDGSYPIVGNITEDFTTIAGRLENFDGFDCANCIKAHGNKICIDNQTLI